MQIQREQPDGLKVVLSGAELGHFGLTYERLDYEDKHTQAMLSTVLEAASAVTGFHRGAGKLLIEVFPAPDKGCAIHFTGTGEAQKRPRRQLRVYAFDTSEAMISAIQSLPPQTADAKSELYELDGRYLLILHGAAPTLREYGTPLSGSKPAVAAIREHGRLLASPHAVAAIRKAVENE